MVVTKSRSAHPLGRLKLPQKGVVFSEKRYTDSSVNLLFNKMRARTPPFHGVLAAEAESKRFYLVIVDNEPYAAGEEQQGIFVPVTLHGLFSGLRKLPAAGAGLTLVGTDPMFLKAVLTMIQCAPTTEGTSEIMEIGSVVEHIKKSAQDQLLVVGYRGELSVFYFRDRQPIAGYFADPAFETGEDSLEERLLAYVYKYAGQTSLSIHVFATMSACPPTTACSSGERGPKHWSNTSRGRSRRCWSWGPTGAHAASSSPPAPSAWVAGRTTTSSSKTRRSPVGT